MPTLLDLLFQLHDDAARVKAEAPAYTQGPKSRTPGGLRSARTSRAGMSRTRISIDDREEFGGIPEHSIAIGTAGPHLAEETPDGW